MKRLIFFALSLGLLSTCFVPKLVLAESFADSQLSTYINTPNDGIDAILQPFYTGTPQGSIADQRNLLEQTANRFRDFLNTNEKNLSPVLLEEGRARLALLEYYHAALDPNINKDQLTTLNQNVKTRMAAVDQAKAQAPAGGEQQISCSWSSPLNCLLIGAANISAAIVWLISWVTWFANEVFNLSIWLSVRQFADYTKPDGGVAFAWAFIRNLVNIAFIFVLLYIAIGTILQIRGVEIKRLTRNVILAALLVNFSFFLVNYAIYGSNVLANVLYTQVGGGSCEPGPTASQNKNCTITGAPDISTQLIKGFMANSWSVWSLKDAPSASDPAYQYKGTYTWGSIIGTSLGQITLLLITAIVLFAGAIMFIVRMIKLLFYLVFSPAMFLGAGFVGPLHEHSQKWLRGLFNNALFAPAFFIPFLMVVRIVGTDSVGVIQKNGGLVGSVMYAILINALMIAAIVVAQKLSIYGGDGAMGVVTGMGNRVRGAIGRNTIGSAAYWTNKQLDKEKGRMAQSRAGRAALWVASSLGGSGLKDKIEGLGNKSTFGGSMSYQQRREKEWQGTADAALKAAGNDTDKIADLVTSYNPGNFGRRDKIDYIYSKLTAAQRHQIQQKLTSKDATEAQKKLYADLDKSWKEANKKKAGNEQKEANKLERQAKEEIDLEEYNKAISDFREAEKNKDEKKLKEAREALKNSAIKLTKGQVKNDVSVEDLMLTAEQKAWGTEQLSGILDERNGSERLNQEQISTLKTTRLAVKEREDKLKESSKKLSQMLTSATATKEDADALVKELGEPMISPLITPTVTVNKNVIRSLKEDVIKTLMRKNFVSFEDQKKIRKAVEKMINSNDPNITDDLLKLNVALEKDPILKNFGKTEEK